MALEVIFKIALGEPAEGDLVEGADGADQQLVGFCCGYPHCLAAAVLEVGKSRRSWRGNQAVNSMARIKGNLLLCFLSWLNRLPT